MKTDEKGCSTCKKGTENYETFTGTVGGKLAMYVQYDFRTEDGQLFSCVGRGLSHCREKRDEWLEKRAMKSLTNILPSELKEYMNTHYSYISFEMTDKELIDYLSQKYIMELGDNMAKVADLFYDMLLASGDCDVQE